MIKNLGLILLSTIFLINSCTPDRPKNVKAVFDIPNLIEKDIDEIRKILGKPDEDFIETTEPGRQTWDNTFKKQGSLLSVSFDPKSRAVNFIYLAPPGDDWTKKDVMKLGNLDSPSAKYWIERGSKFNMDGDYSTIRVIPS
ncbi:MAG TPA: hypothetical protein VNI52_08420 [Sphingobacteriaceae bacterium]|nr:hypothetical protein [Sphingobacteriaceae bacterium]